MSVEASRGVGWLAPLQQWPQTALDSLRARGAVARIVIAGVRGSAPREAGTCMLLDAKGTYGSIGGGQLEWAAMVAARELLAGGPSVRVLKLVLGTELEQCCGGVVELWIERYTSADTEELQTIAKAVDSGRGMLVSTWRAGQLERRLVPTTSQPRWQCDASGASAELCELLPVPATPLWLFGAGHVGQALVRVLEPLPFAITWVESRIDVLPDGVAPAVHAMRIPDPVTAVVLAPPGALFLVMTHSHPLDYALCRAVLGRGDAAWLGLIGSQSKAARFRSRLTRDGIAAAQIERLVSPIGIPGIESKLPAAIAIAVAAQLLAWQSAQTQVLIRTGATPRELAAAPACRGCAAAPGGC